MIRQITQILVLVSVVLWVAWDIYANATPGATESEVIRDWQLTYPAIAWGIGVVFGHLTLWRRSRWVPEGKTGPIAIGILSAGVVAVTLFFDLTWVWIPRLGIAGAIAGTVFWSQKPEHSHHGTR